MNHFKVSPNGKRYSDGLTKLFTDKGVYSVHINDGKGRLQQTKSVKPGDILHIVSKNGEYWIGSVLSKFNSVTKETSFYSLNEVKECRLRNRDIDHNPLLVEDYYNTLWETEVVCKVDWNKSTITEEKKKKLNQGFNAKTIKALPWFKNQDVDGEVFLL